MKNFYLLLTISLFSLNCSNDKTEVVDDSDCTFENLSAKGNRLIGIDLLDLTETNSFNDNLQLAEDLGIEFIALHVPWTSIEPSPNNFEDPGSSLQLLNQTAKSANLKFSLTIKPIDLSGKTVPVDLDVHRFNDPELINRFEALIDFIFTKVDPSILLNIQLGNEIDGYDTSGEPQTFWADYGEFLNNITDHIHAKDPEVQVGFTARLNELVLQPQLFNNLLDNVDILGVTYYPLGSNFNVNNPDVVSNDFSNLVASYDKIPIYLQEIGYQSSSINNSNEDKQAEFYCNIFKAWDMHSTRILAANIVRLNDLSFEGAEESAANYNLTDQEFTEYLRTLGIRNYDGMGTPKKAYETIRANLSERGW